MAYEKNTPWVNGDAVNSPLSAERLNRLETQYDEAAAFAEELIYTELDALAVEWADVNGKPTQFAPTAHVHSWSEINQKPTQFAPAAHTHAWADVTGAPSFAPASHTHTIANVTGLRAELDGKAALDSVPETGGLNEWGYLPTVVIPLGGTIPTPLPAWGLVIERAE